MFVPGARAPGAPCWAAEGLEAAIMLRAFSGLRGEIVKAAMSAKFRYVWLYGVGGTSGDALCRLARASGCEAVGVKMQGGRTMKAVNGGVWRGERWRKVFERAGSSSPFLRNPTWLVWGEGSIIVPYAIYGKLHICVATLPL